MATTPQGRWYPDPQERTPNRKSAKRLQTRTDAYDAMAKKESADIVASVTRPGSYKKS